MEASYKEISERHFLEGLSAAHGGLLAESCPYEYSDNHSQTSWAIETAPLNWMEGWQLGRFAMMQSLREERFVDSQSAAMHLSTFQHDYAEACRVSNQGFRQAGLKKIWAGKYCNEIAAKIRSSREFKLLQDLCYEFYLPWRPSEAPYAFRVFDRQLSVFGGNEETLRSLLTRYGDRHGVRSIWEQYVRAGALQYPLYPHIETVL